MNWGSSFTQKETTVGVFSMFSSCSDSNYSTGHGLFSQYREQGHSQQMYSSGNPNPRRYVILRTATFGKNLVAEILYPDCNNYEGRKVLVYQNTKERDLENTSFLDPHFCDHRGHVSPFARFEPTHAGWKAACTCARFL